MSDGYNGRELRRAITALSHASDWEIVRKEWALVEIYEAEQPETCLCGHFPIVEICVLRNGITKQRADVGNVCVKKFLGLRSHLLFAGIKRVRADVEKSLNTDSITFFRERNVLTAWECTFCQDTMRTRTLSAKQMRTRIGINQKVLAVVAKRGLQVHGR